MTGAVVVLDVPPEGSTVIPIRSLDVTLVASTGPAWPVRGSRPAERAPAGPITHSWYTCAGVRDGILVVMTTASCSSREVTTVTVPPTVVCVVSVRASGAASTSVIAALLALALSS